MDGSANRPQTQKGGDSAIVKVGIGCARLFFMADTGANTDLSFRYLYII